MKFLHVGHAIFIIASFLLQVGGPQGVTGPCWPLPRTATESHQCERNRLKSASAVDQRDKESEESIFHLKESHFMSKPLNYFITTTDKNSI